MDFMRFFVIVAVSIVILFFICFFYRLFKYKIKFSLLKKRYTEKIDKYKICMSRIIFSDNRGTLSKAKRCAERRSDVVVTVLDVYRRLLSLMDYENTVYTLIQVSYRGTTNVGYRHNEQITVYKFLPANIDGIVDLNKFRLQIKSVYGKNKWKGVISKKEYIKKSNKVEELYNAILLNCSNYFTTCKLQQIKDNHFDIKSEYSRLFHEYEFNYKKVDRSDVIAERYISSKLRETILNRDGYTCCKCSLGIPEISKTSLHIDHIIPVSRGGKSTLDNLQTLCANCNMDKSNKIL